MPSFHELCTLTPGGTDEERVAIATEDWGQGRALFGGAMAGMALGALGELVPEGRALRGFVASFVAPVAPGPVGVRARVLRSGRAMTQGAVELSQAGQVCFTLSAAYGAGRASPLRLVAARGPVDVAPEALPRFSALPGVTPVFVQHFEYRWAGSAFPFTGSDVAALGGWVRFADGTPVGAPELAAMLDAWPAPVLPMFPRPAPASTVTWMVNVIEPPPPERWPGEAWWRFHADAVATAEGYCDVEARLWAADGRLVATSRQLVAEFA